MADDLSIAHCAKKPSDAQLACILLRVPSTATVIVVYRKLLGLAIGPLADVALTALEVIQRPVELDGDSINGGDTSTVRSRPILRPLLPLVGRASRTRVRGRSVHPRAVPGFVELLTRLGVGKLGADLAHPMVDVAARTRMRSGPVLLRTMLVLIELLAHRSVWQGSTDLAYRLPYSRCRHYASLANEAPARRSRRTPGR